MADIYLLIESKQEGPYTEEQVRQALAEGQITNDVLAWKEGLAEWVALSGVLIETNVPAMESPPSVQADEHDHTAEFSKTKFVEDVETSITTRLKHLDVLKSSDATHSTSPNVLQPHTGSDQIGRVDYNTIINTTPRPDKDAQVRFNSVKILTVDQWVGFATRTIPLNWLGTVGILCAAFSCLAIMIGGLPLLSDTRDPDYNEAVMTLVVGIGLLVVGLLLIMLVAILQKRELKRGKLYATGVFWNPTTHKKLEGKFEFDIDSGTQMSDEPKGFKHRCNAIRHVTTQASDRKYPQISKPILRMIFDVDSGLAKGEFASGVFKKHSSADTIIFANGSITRVNGSKENPCSLCTEIGNLLKYQAPNLIDVKLVVNLNTYTAAPIKSSNAGVTGAVLFGAVGGVVGAVIEEKQEQRKKKEQAAQQAAHEEAVNKLFSRLEKVAAEFGWATNILRNAV